MNYLANKSGISNSDNIEDNFNYLCKWNIVQNEDYDSLNNQLDYEFMAKTICNLIQDKDVSINNLSNRGWISKVNDQSKNVNRLVAQGVVDNAVSLINNREFERKYECEYIKTVKDKQSDLLCGDLLFDDDDNSYKIITSVSEDQYTTRDAEFNEVFSSLDIADSFVVNFEDAEIIPLQEEIKSSYINNKYQLLASKNHVFNYDGFRISYTINASGIDVHVSKKVDRTTIYGDASINAIKPSFKWTYEKGDLKNCYFNIKMNSTTSLGATIGKYGNYYLKLKDLDSSSFMSSIKSMIVPKADEQEAIIPICQVKTPIPNIPLLYLNMTVGIKLYISGKTEIVIYNTHNIGFEVNDGNFRYFYEHDDDVDAIARSSCKSAIALNVGLDEANFRLCDLELDGGLKAELKTTVHLYDSDFNETEQGSDIEYSTMDEISKDNPYVKVCGDVSLYWLLDLICNTSKSILYKMGFSKTINILDEDNQVFGNMHHIENGQFVKKCTRKSNKAITNSSLQINTSNKIVLNTYAEVIKVNDIYKIEVIALPDGYTDKDIRYTSSDVSVATVDNGVILARNTGTAKINVHTSDNKYNTYINVLVSTG